MATGLLSSEVEQEQWQCCVHDGGPTAWAGSDSSSERQASTVGHAAAACG
jgi:hypothetical protein